MQEQSNEPDPSENAVQRTRCKGNQMNSIIVETHHNEPDARAIKFRFCGGSDIVRGTENLGRRAILLCRK